MKHLVTIFFCLAFSLSALSQVNFQTVYQSNVFVPQGLLEAVAWTNTRMVHLDQTIESCSGLPKAYGIMGLHDDGKNYFIENGKIVAEISGIDVASQKLNAQTQILAYAKAFNVLMASRVSSPSAAKDPTAIRNILLHLSEIPDSGVVNTLARDLQVFEILKFMMSSEKAAHYNFSPHHFNLQNVFGENNYRVLSGSYIRFTKKGIKAEDGSLYTGNDGKSIQYGPAIWNPAPTCNFSSRNGVPISAITIHTVQGTYAGAISWAQNCSSGVSYHYVIRSSDGQVTQMVLEEDKAWHVGSENPYTIGYEHEGYVNNPIWYTEEMYTSSANLSKDVVNSGYGIPPLRTYHGPATSGVNVIGGCTKIKGHQHYPNQTHVDPGIYWNWEKYYRLINDNPPVTLITTTSGTFYDSGGAGGSYQDDERMLWLFQPSNGQNVVLDFTSFSIESGYDNLYFYDGDSIGSPFIGSFTGTNSPGIVSSTGPSLLVEFRSDCSTISSGWVANMSTVTPDLTPPTTAIIAGSLWQTDNFDVDFVDQDNQSGIGDRYYLVAGKNTGMMDWQAEGNFGFAHETFENNVANWTVVTGTFMYSGSTYDMTDPGEQNSNAYINLDQDATSSYLFEWEQIITSSGANQRAGLHFFCSDPTLPNRGESYFIYLRENDDKAQIYRVTNDVFNLVSDVPLVVNAGQNYNCKVSYDPISGWIKLFVNDAYVSAWQDPLPLVNGTAASFRSGGCTVIFDNFFVYKSRGSQVLISAGNGEEMSIESTSAISSGAVRSLVRDLADNWSDAVYEEYLLDFTAPAINFMNDGFSSDIDTFYTSAVEGTWDTEDVHSSVVSYEYAIGTLPNTADVISWTNNGLSEIMSELVALPTYGQIYYLSVKALNGAGLENIFVSDGQIYLGDLSLSESPFGAITIYPNPVSNELVILTGLSELYYQIYDSGGKLCSEGKVDGTIDVKTLTDGAYRIILRYGNLLKAESLIIKK